MLCSVVKHLRSGRALKKWGKALDCVSSFPLHFFRALALPACFTTEQSTVEASLFVNESPAEQRDGWERRKHLCYETKSKYLPWHSHHFVSGSLSFTLYFSTQRNPYPVSSWFLLRQTREKPLRATVCFSIEHARVWHAARDAFDVNSICQLQSKQVKRSSHEWIKKFIIANLISVIISINCSPDE